MRVQRYIVARSLNHCCHGNATISSLFVVVDVAVTVNNTEVFIVAIVMQ